MDFYEVLSDIMREKHMSIPDVAVTCGLTDSAVFCFLKPPKNRYIIGHKSTTMQVKMQVKLIVAFWSGLCYNVDVSWERRSFLGALFPAFF